MRRYQRGDLVPVALVTLDNNRRTLDVREADLEISVRLQDSAHAEAFGNACRVGGLGDARGSVVAVLDLDSQPYNAPPRIMPGVPVLLLFYLAAADPTRVQVPMRVEKFRWAHSAESFVSYGLDLLMDRDAGTAGFQFAPDTFIGLAPVPDIRQT